MKLRSFDLAVDQTGRIIEDACVLFGAWTICAQIVVFAGGTLYHLVGAYLMVLPPLLAMWRRVRGTEPARVAAVTRRAKPHVSWALMLPEAGALALAASAAAAFVSGRPILGWWLVLCAALLGALGMAGATRVRLAFVGPARRCELMLCGLALIVGLAGMLADRVNFDDSLYVHVSVASIDRPDVPLLTEDTMHGLTGVAVRLPAHKVRAFELLHGAAALVSGVEPITIFHLLTPFLGAVLIPFAWARLFRLVAPRYWFAATLAIVAIYLGVGEANRWYSNFGIVRIWQGKSIFLAAFLPAVYAFAIEFAAKPSRRRWWLLFAAQSGCIGLTSSALWAAPLAAGLGLITGLGRLRDGGRTLVAGVAASSFVIATALVVRSDIATMARGLRVARVPDPGRILSEAMTLVLGNGRMLVVSIVVLGCGWVFSPRGSMARRFAVVMSAVPLLIMLNPYAVGIVRGNTTGPDYWRIFWAIPLPALIALVLVAPLRGRRPPAFGWAATVALTAALVIFGTSYTAVGPRNQIRWRPPGLKVDRAAYELARRINEFVPEAAPVIVPTDVGRWIPTFRRHAYSVWVRDDYLSIPLTQQDERRLLATFADGADRSPAALRRFEEALIRYTIRAVCLRIDGAMGPIQGVLTDAGFVRSFADEEVEIWVYRPVSGSSGPFP